MANGRTHFVANVIGGTALTLATKVYVQDEQAWYFVAVGATIGAICTPDMDLEGRTFTEEILRHIPFVGLFYQVSWYPYAVLFGHRGTSHNIIFGTATRVIYSAALIAFWLIFSCGILWLCGLDPAIFIKNVFDFMPLLASPWLFIAWYAQDLIHYLLDL